MRALSRGRLTRVRMVSRTGLGVSTYLEGGLRETLRFYARAFNLRMGWMVFLVSFFLLPILAMGAELLHSRLMYQQERGTTKDGMRSSENLKTLWL